MKLTTPLLMLTMIILLPACSPHPASGVWQTTEDNVYGISRLVVGFEGRANFVTTKLNNATWHCFWSATSKQKTELNCKPSTDSEQEETFILTINDNAMAELRHNAKLVAIFTRQDENPSPKD